MFMNLMVWATNAVYRVNASDEEGQTLVEYALIIALVSVALIVALTGLKTGIAGAFTKAVTALA